VSTSAEHIGVRSLSDTLPLLASMSAQGVPLRTANAVTIFDDSKMTKNAVAYAHDSIFRSPIDRIGMYRSPQAMHLTMGATVEHIKGSAFSSPVPKRQPETVLAASML